MGLVFFWCQQQIYATWTYIFFDDWPKKMKKNWYIYSNSRILQEKGNFYSLSLPASTICNIICLCHRNGGDLSSKLQKQLLHYLQTTISTSPHFTPPTIDFVCPRENCYTTFISASICQACNNNLQHKLYMQVKREL